MIVSVISSVHGQGGNSTIAMLISYLLSAHSAVCLTHLSADEDTFHDYLGIERSNDLTCSTSQIVNLLGANAITLTDIKDYCTSVKPNLDIFFNNDADIDMVSFLKKLPYDFVVVDVDISVSDSAVKSLLQDSEVVVVTLSQSQNVLGRYNKYLKPLIADTKAKCLFLCNKYSQTIGSMPQFSRQIGASLKECLQLHNSGLLTKCANNKRIFDFFKYTEELPDVAADLQHIDKEFKLLKEKKK